MELAQESAGVALAQECAVEEQVLGTMPSPHNQPGPPKARVSLPLAGLGKPRVMEPSSPWAAASSLPRATEPSSSRAAASSSPRAEEPSSPRAAAG